MFYFSKFTIAQHNIILALPDTTHAEDLFNTVNNDRATLSRWMSWTNTTLSVDDEKQFINYARVEIAKHHLLLLTIIVDNQAVGMVDLHQIDWQNRTAELGYWLSSEFQGKGIITTAVNQLVSHAFNHMLLHKVILQADSENDKSIAVAHRLGFLLEATLKQQVRYQDTFKDMCIFAKFNPKNNQLEN